MPGRVRVRLTRQQVNAALRRLPGLLSGREPDPTGEVQAIQTRLGVQALSLIKEAFIQKSRGGTDEAGDRWEPLRGTTLALRMRNFSPTAARVNKLADILSKSEDSRKAQVRVQFERLRRTLFREGAGKVASRNALRILEAMRPNISQGRYKRLRNVLTADLSKPASRKRLWGLAFTGAFAEILRDSGVLLNSLSPGVNGASGDPGQVFRLEPGAVIVGTNVPYAVYHHSDEPRKLKKNGEVFLPQRRLWPRQLPRRWQELLAKQAADGSSRLVARLLEVP
jgi:hypothetical protein